MKITKDMRIQEVVEKYPQSVPVFFKHGLGCLGCAAAHFETIEQGATAHGIAVDALIADLNKAIAE
jgi:hybrid cluster-associated redox disulfide protein